MDELHELFRKVAAIYLKDGCKKVIIREYQSALIDLDQP